MKKSEIENNDINREDESFPGYPHYTEEEDVYMQLVEEVDIDPETRKLKSEVEEEEPLQEIVVDETDLYQELSGADLDVPGAELDDAMEEVGSEDEENNYYSLGGDNHENQEEDKTQ